MHRFHLPPTACLGDRLTLTADEAAHASRVLRLSVGDVVTVLDGAGTEAVCNIENVSRGAVSLTVVERRTHERPFTAVMLLQAVTKARSMDVILQKATELGATGIVPVLAERCVPDFTPREAERKRAKWQAVTVEAMKQCGTAWLPVVHPPMSLRTVLAGVGRQPDGLALLGDLAPGTESGREMFARQRRSPEWPPRLIRLWIGPEGDFAPQEYEAIRASGAVSMSFGPRVLRSETAAIYG
ncbi:MAG: 16S rRNA (uracil(1498)-N(3))-methyltransferase, partial [Verrucomicrobiae bacterium]|nr:16S rRNA (uracil(1498)-N(3))-methyltransferase [Verrucomicrobiae bacterium]